MLQRLVVPNAHGGYAKKSNVSSVTNEVNGPSLG